MKTEQLFCFINFFYVLTFPLMFLSYVISDPTELITNDSFVMKTLAKYVD